MEVPETPRAPFDDLLSAWIQLQVGCACCNMKPFVIYANIENVDQVLDDLTKCQGYDSQIVTAKSQYRNTDENSKNSSNHCTYQDCKDQSWNRREQITGNMGKYSTGISSNAHKASMSKTQLSGITNYQVQGKGSDGVNADGNQKSGKQSGQVSG